MEVPKGVRVFTSKFLCLDGGISGDRGSFLPGDAQCRCNFPRVNVSFVSRVVQDLCQSLEEQKYKVFELIKVLSETKRSSYFFSTKRR